MEERSIPDLIPISTRDTLWLPCCRICPSLAQTVPVHGTNMCSKWEAKPKCFAEQSAGRTWHQFTTEEGLVAKLALAVLRCLRPVACAYITRSADVELHWSLAGPASPKRPLVVDGGWKTDFGGESRRLLQLVRVHMRTTTAIEAPHHGGLLEQRGRREVKAIQHFCGKAAGGI